MKNNKGFTIVELMVATSLFLVLLSVAILTFVQALRTQQTITELAAANDNATLSLEQMTREVRTGNTFEESTSSLLRFNNYKGEKVNYKLITNLNDISNPNDDTRSIGLCVGTCHYPNPVDTDFNAITAPEVKVDKLAFFLSGQSDTDNLATRVTIILSIAGPKGIKVNLQSTTSPRLAN